MPSALLYILSEPKQISEIIPNAMSKFLENAIYQRGIDDEYGLALFYIDYIKPSFSNQFNGVFSPVEFAKHLKSKNILPLEIIANFIEMDFSNQASNQAWIEQYNVSLN